MEFPRHAASLTLTHNDHKNVYETVAQWAEGSTDNDNPWCDWVSDEQRAKAIATDSVWTLRWYPSTPIGFIALAAADLDVLMARALEIQAEEDAACPA